MHRAISMALLAVAMSLLLAARLTVATLISSSQLELCYRSNGSVAVNDIPCTKKFVVSVTLDGGQNATEEIVYWQSAVDATTQQHYTLSAPIRISLTKSRPLTVYPLTYERNFNAKPRESTIYTTLTPKCKDSPSDGSPTCGRFYDDAGAPMEFSEGFCCSCNICQLFGLCGNDDRGNSRCALFNTAAAAACLRFDDLWYSGYRIGAAQTWYRITVRISGNNVSSELLLGPDRLAAVSPAAAVSARLIGDFAPFLQPINLEGTYLFVPATPASNSRVQAGKSEWLLVPRDRVTVDGRECNKIGVSFEGFTTQPSRCDAPTGSCLHNQLLDLRLEDDARVRQGRSAAVPCDGPWKPRHRVLDCSGSIRAGPAPCTRRLGVFTSVSVVRSH
jgi:hypothetical protein